jgi:hypothetical protein
MAIAKALGSDRKEAEKHTIGRDRRRTIISTKFQPMG